MKLPWATASRPRVLIGAVGVLLGSFGAFRLLSEVPGSALLALAVWLVGALVLHDVVLSPLVVGIGTALGRVPARARTYVQSALLAGGLVTVIAVPLMYRAGTQPRAEAILNQDYAGNLLTLLAMITVVALLSYLRRVVQGRSDADEMPPTRTAPPVPSE